MSAQDEKGQVYVLEDLNDEYEGQWQTGSQSNPIPVSDTADKRIHSPYWKFNFHREILFLLRSGESSDEIAITLTEVQVQPN